MLLVVGGVCGSLIGGYILDKSKAYKYVKNNSSIFERHKDIIFVMFFFVYFLIEK